jgi:hypothetical protein
MHQTKLLDDAPDVSATTPECAKARLVRVRFPEHYLHTLAKQRARSNGLEFTITIADVVIPATCPLLGIPLAFDVSSGKQGGKDNSPTLDRIDNARGYVPGNVRVISWRANRMKGDATLEELETLVRNMRERGG